MKTFSNNNGKGSDKYLKMVIKSLTEEELLASELMNPVTLSSILKFVAAGIYVSFAFF